MPPESVTLKKSASRWRRRSVYRLLEILPGGAVWLALAAAIIISFVRPLWAILFILVFDVYWLIRVLYIMVYVVIAWRRFRQTQTIDWLARLQTEKNWQNIYHLVFLPTYREPLAVVEATIRSLTRVNYPLDHLLIVLAIEERDAVQARTIAAAMTSTFGSAFGGFFVTEHPANIPGELAGKGANAAWAGRQILPEIERRGIAYEDVIVSTFDVDSVAHPQYFAYLTNTFLQHPDRQRSSYQPIPVFHNNVWDALFLMRVVANSTTFWLLSETQRPDRLFTFSSHSMPLRALVDVDWWQTDVVNEDSRIFLQCFLHYNGHYTVTPLYLPISMDTVQAPSWRHSVSNQFKQIQRWAYGGTENFAFSLWNFFQNPAIPVNTKLRYAWIQWEGIFSWATAPILIFLLGWLPFAISSQMNSPLAVVYNGPIALQHLMWIAMVGLIVSSILSTVMLPPRPTGVPWYRWVMMIGQWFFLPITMILFGSIPAIDAQTRMMLGRYMGFVVTEKMRLAPTRLTANDSPESLGTH